jgi:hypothetical protein
VNTIIIIITIVIIIVIIIIIIIIITTIITIIVIQDMTGITMSTNWPISWHLLTSITTKTT